jgi:hypothetical protein
VPTLAPAPAAVRLTPVSLLVTPAAELNPQRRWPEPDLFRRTSAPFGVSSQSGSGFAVPGSDADQRSADTSR